MGQMWILAVARPWHYWMAVSLLAMGVALVVAIAVGYYRQVLVPLYQRRTAELESPESERAAVGRSEGQRRLERPSHPQAA